MMTGDQGMSLRLSFALVTVACAVLCVPAAAQEEGMGGGMQEMEMPKPGPEHQWLAKWAGTWDAVMKFRMSEEQPWQEVKGTLEARMGLNGFWLMSEFTCNFMGTPFKGQELMGYDPFKKKFVSTWVSNMDPQVTVSYGTLSEDKKTLTMTGEVFDKHLGKRVEMRMVTSIEGPDKHVWAMYSEGPTGEEMKGMEITYTRRKGEEKEEGGEDK